MIIKIRKNFIFFDFIRFLNFLLSNVEIRDIIYNGITVGGGMLRLDIVVSLF